MCATSWASPLLNLIFFLIVTLLGLVLGAVVKDLLELKRDPHAKSWWKSARTSREFERMFCKADAW